MIGLQSNKVIKQGVIMIKEYIDQNEFYLIKDEQRYCCDESQFVYVCKAHGEQMDCYYCGFNYSENCEEQH
jgi:hypothetical protein